MKTKQLLTMTLALGSMGSLAVAAPQTLGLSGTLPDLNHLEVESGHVYDYTFTTAPTDWKVQSGIWEMTNRWSCSPGWSWFGGRSDEVASVWNKRTFEGDLSVQYYFAFKMGVAQARSWPEYPADAAITIHGDGQNLSSGYSLIVGADENTRTILMKNAQVVAETREPAALLPTFADGRVADNELHRRWWYVRMDKRGNRVSCFLDGKQILTYDDPQPLSGGQVALWTYNNGIMLSRVQLFFERERQPLYVKQSPPAKAPSLTTVKNKMPAAVPPRPVTAATKSPTRVVQR